MLASRLQPLNMFSRISLLGFDIEIKHILHYVHVLVGCFVLLYVYLFAIVDIEGCLVSKFYRFGLTE